LYGFSVKKDKKENYLTLTKGRGCDILKVKPKTDAR